jgi:hypothetical protein
VDRMDIVKAALEFNLSCSFGYAEAELVAGMFLAEAKKRECTVDKIGLSPLGMCYPESKLDYRDVVGILILIRKECLHINSTPFEHTILFPNTIFSKKLKGRGFDNLLNFSEDVK